MRLLKISFVPTAALLLALMASCGIASKSATPPTPNPVPVPGLPSHVPPAPLPPTPQPAPARVVLDTDVTCTGTYGTRPFHLIFLANGTCWFQDHGPDECSFKMEKKKVHLSVGRNGISGLFEDDCSAVNFGGQVWKKTE